MFKNRKSLPQIVSVFKQTIEDLKTLIEGNTEQQSVNNLKIGDLNVKNRDLNEESNQASKVLENISKLINN